MEKKNAGPTTSRGLRCRAQRGVHPEHLGRAPGPVSSQPGRRPSPPLRSQARHRASRPWPCNLRRCTSSTTSSRSVRRSRRSVRARAGASRPVTRSKGRSSSSTRGLHRSARCGGQQNGSWDMSASSADLGEILIPFGEFLENNHVLMQGPFRWMVRTPLAEKAIGELPLDGNGDGTPALAWSGIRCATPSSIQSVLPMISPSTDLQLAPLTHQRRRTLSYGSRLIRPRREELPRAGYVPSCVLFFSPRRLKSRLGPRTSKEASWRPWGIRRRPREDCGRSHRGPRPRALAFVTRACGFPASARPHPDRRLGWPVLRRPRRGRCSRAPHSLLSDRPRGRAQRLLPPGGSKDTSRCGVGLRICSACGSVCSSECSCGGHTTSRNGPARQRVPIAEVCGPRGTTWRDEAYPRSRRIQGMISEEQERRSLSRRDPPCEARDLVFRTHDSIRHERTSLSRTSPERGGISVDEARPSRIPREDTARTSARPR